jgi:hypothetical protein
MSDLKVNRLDSPIARRTAREPDPSEPTKPRETPPKRSQSPAARKPTLARVPEAQESRRRQAGDATAPSLDALPNPPSLSESLELLSTRLPSSLRRSLSELTMALRARSHTRQSQKALPEQEVLAVLIWLAGDPADPATIQRLGSALDAYRGRRYAAEARTLGS